MENGLVTADGTKILTVEEYDRFITTIPESMKAIFEINTITGLRYIELQRLYENPQWYYKERNQIILPKEAQKKEKQKLPKRTIDKLSTTFSYVFFHFLNGKKPPYRSSWNKDLTRSVLHQLDQKIIYPHYDFKHLTEKYFEIGMKLDDFLIQLVKYCRWSEKADVNPKVGPKTPRKTIESWMLKTGIPEIEIYSRQGHDPITSLKHYQSLSFTDYELRDIKKRLVEWGILRRGI